MHKSYHLRFRGIPIRIFLCDIIFLKILTYIYLILFLIIAKEIKYRFSYLITVLEDIYSPETAAVLITIGDTDKEVAGILIFIFLYFEHIQIFTLTNIMIINGDTTLNIFFHFFRHKIKFFNHR
jgi:hypothetical protein